MLSLAAPIHAGGESVSPPTTPPPLPPAPPSSPVSIRSRRIALLQPPPLPPQNPPASPPVPARSPLRLIPKSQDVPVSAPDSALSKRKHALLELLTSERAYASDLALIRDIHMPLALGQPSPFLTSSASPTSPHPPAMPQVPAMTKEDTRIIFGNVDELAVVSEVFCEKLEEALHGVLDPHGDGRDCVAEVFLSMIPHMQPPYTTYITRHPSAVAHLNGLPPSPALTAYLAQTHTLAQSYTHAWDLPSLLIKPVQRLLKYPLLLTAIMDDTEPGAAKDKLREARDKVEEVARGVNEGRRRWEVVRNFLDTKHPPPVRLKSIRGLRNRYSSKDDQGQLERFEKRLHECKTFVRDFAKDIVEWVMALRDEISQLERWSVTFGRLIGLGQPHGSEALGLFTEIVSSQIFPIWISLETAIQDTLLPKLARLLATTDHPLLLLDHMRVLRPQHLQLLDTPISKTRPPNSLVDASQSYVALDAQLRAELPRYMDILERGLLSCLRQFADWQARFWKEVRAQWVELWDALGVEGDMAAGAADTVKVWWDRWESVDADVSKLNITQPKYHRTSPSHNSQGPTAALATAFVSGAVPARLSSVSTPTTLASFNRNNRSAQSLDLDGSVGWRGPLGSPGREAMTASPDSYVSLGASLRRESDVNSISTKETIKLREDERLKMAVQNGNERPGVSRRESERLPIASRDSPRRFTARHNSEKLPMRRENGIVPASPSAGQRENGLSTVGQDHNKSGITQPLEKRSVDSPMSSHHPSSQPSPRYSIHTSSSSSVSDSSSRRLSRQSLDVHVGMDTNATQPPSSRTSLAPKRSFGGPLGASVIDLVSTLRSGVPLIPGPPTSTSEPASLTASKTSPSTNNEGSQARGRVSKKPSMRKRFADAFRSPSKRRSASRVTVPSLPEAASRQSQSSSAVRTTESVSYPRVPIYRCTVVHPFSLEGLPLPLYRGLPFLGLQIGDKLDILAEEGHPRDHEELPLRPEDDDCQDCLLLARDENAQVGWALASFLIIWS